MEQATREILWNVNSPFTYIGMYGSMFLALAVAAAGIWSRIELWNSGKPDPERTPSVQSICKDFLTWALLQRGVVKRKAAGFFHTLMYLGFLVLLFTTTMVFIHHDLGIKIYQGDFYLLVTLLSDVFGIGVLVGCLLAFHRRWVRNEDLVHNRPADSLMLIFLSLLIVQGFLLEGLRIHVTNDPWAAYSPIGLAFSNFFWGVSKEGARIIHKLMWWFHTFTVFAVFAVVPYTKFFHIVASTINVSLRTQKRSKAAAPFPGDMEKLMETSDEFSLGLGSIKDYTWKQLLDLDACTSCGRCQDVCPAYNSGKVLSPKWMILDTRNHMLSLHSDKKIITESKVPAFFGMLDSKLLKGFLSSIGMWDADQSFRAQNELVQKAPKEKLGVELDARIAGEVMDADVFWSCTTCMACVTACPVGINHVDQIIENRRNMALMHGEIPHEAQGTLRGLEGKGNPYGPKEERSKWFKDLDLKVLNPGDEVDYLYWVGCVSSYDPRKQKIAKSLVTIMKAAGLSFGVLGNAEGCTGDPARRLGEENLFQTLAKSNLEILKSVKFKYIVANCPHCFNTIKNEYPQLGNLGNGRSPEIIHHSVLLRNLLAEEKIKVKQEGTKFTFHDPCYLGRYNNEYDAPRQALQAATTETPVEMERTREKSFCCGAGGGHFWMDMKVGKRVNSLRVIQAKETEAGQIATACPFCMQMLEDGIKLNDLESTMQVRDIAEVIADNLIV